MAKKPSADRPVAQKALLDEARAEQKPPYVYLLLDEESVKCLALGAVNARVEVSARKSVDALYSAKE